MWNYLEPLFIHSDEVKNELPRDTKRFEKIDGELKATLMELWNVKKVRAVIPHNTLLASCDTNLCRLAYDTLSHVTLKCDTFHARIELR